MRIEPGLTGYMTERGMRWHVIRADGTHEMQDASGRPFIRVKAWRKPNEDGAERLQHVQWDGTLSHRPLQQPECLRCYPRCFKPMDHRELEKQLADQEDRNNVLLATLAVIGR